MPTVEVEDQGAFEFGLIGQAARRSRIDSAARRDLAAHTDLHHAPPSVHELAIEPTDPHSATIRGGTDPDRGTILGRLTAF
jgi:hypothetical protein